MAPTGEEISRYRSEIHFQYKFEHVKKELRDKGDRIYSPIFYLRNLPFKLGLVSVVEDDAEKRLRCVVTCKPQLNSFVQ